jgi:hypothetical protein
MAAMLAGGQQGKRSQVPCADCARVLIRGSFRHGWKPDADSPGLDDSGDVGANATACEHSFRRSLLQARGRRFSTDGFCHSLASIGGCAHGRAKWRVERIRRWVGPLVLRVAPDQTDMLPRAPLGGSPPRPLHIGREWQGCISHKLQPQKARKYDTHFTFQLPNDAYQCMPRGNPVRNVRVC